MQRILICSQTTLTGEIWSTDVVTQPILGVPRIILCTEEGAFVDSPRSRLHRSFFNNSFKNMPI